MNLEINAQQQYKNETKKCNKNEKQKTPENIIIPKNTSGYYDHKMKSCIQPT